MHNLHIKIKFMQLKSDTSYFFSKTVMLSIEPLLIYIWKHLELFHLAGLHRAICAVKTQYLNCSKKMKWKQLYIKLNLDGMSSMMTKMDQ